MSEAFDESTLEKPNGRWPVEPWSFGRFGAEK